MNEVALCSNKKKMSINTDKNVVAFFSSDSHIVKWQPFILLIMATASIQ